jgi:hypothetical protein
MKRKYPPVAVAYLTLQEQMKPLFVRAKAESLFFRNRHSHTTYTWQELSKLLKAGFMLQGPSHWWLIDSNNRRVA